MIQPRSGVWWTDSDPSTRVPGTLSRADSQWQLDLIGTLPVNQDWEDRLSLVPPVTIYGACSGQRFTLQHSYLSSTTGPVARYDVPKDPHDQADDQFSQIWFGFSLLEGDALSEETIYKRAQFELTGLSEWWPFGSLRGPNPPTDIDGYTAPDPTIAECASGMTVTIAALVSGRSGKRVHSLSERVVVEVRREEGFTSKELFEQVVSPLQNLLSIILHLRVEWFNCQLQPHHEGIPAYAPLMELLPISVDPGVIDSASERDVMGVFPLFTAEEVKAPEFIARWIDITSRAVVPAAVAALGSQSGSLQIQVVEAVNAAESLHRELYAEPSNSPFADKVSEVLKSAGGLNSKERAKVKSAVRLTEITLEARLLELAQGLGDEFCGWFFQGQVKEWAAIAAVVRNALSHGYPTGHRIERDPGALSGVLRLTRAVIRLRLLTEAGLPGDSKLKGLANRDDHYRALARQSVADWQALRAAVGS